MDKLKRLRQAFSTYMAIADGKPVIANLNPSHIHLGKYVKGMTFYGFRINPDNKYRLEIRAVRNYRRKP